MVDPGEGWNLIFGLLFLSHSEDFNGPFVSMSQPHGSYYDDVCALLPNLSLFLFLSLFLPQKSGFIFQRAFMMLDSLPDRNMALFL